MLKKIFIPLFFIGFAFISYSQDGSETKSCSDCHDGSEKDAAVITSSMIEKSVHEGSDCVECHEDIAEIPHQEKLAKVECGNCHEEAKEIFKKHGRFAVGQPDIPGCANCHGTHEILAPDDKQSAVHPLNMPKTCGKCHEDPDLTQEHTFLPKKPVQTYQASVHGKATRGGIYTAATCNDCHSSNGSAHRILSPGDPDSTINHFAIPHTCGQCHQAIEKDYWEGIHGQFTARGETDSPVCTSCHGEHQIYSHLDKRSSVNPTTLAEATCSPCHESATLTEKYGLPAGRLASFIDSYHGLKSKAGDITVANCASCHGAHRILRHENPDSSIHVNNLQHTCGECHPGISQELATTKIHIEGDTERHGWPYFFTVLYIAIIAVTLTGMLFYIFLDMWRQTRNLALKEQIRRMTTWAVLQHSMLLISFFVLVITGFALRFSDSWWAVLLFGREGGFSIRNLAHRISAVLLILTSLMHLFYLASTKGVEFIKDIFPDWSDLKQLSQMMTYNFGFSNEKPKFGRFSYIEKFEYWALVWGLLIMSITGIMLWFDNFFVGYLGKGILEVVLVIHYYEAWLATLSILIWHLYATIFNPQIYPMNLSWMTGKMPKDQYQHEHPAEKIEE